MTREEAVQRIERAADEKLMKLDLSGLELEEVPLEIVKCTHLRELDLSSNQISSIPEVLGQLSNLTRFDFISNQISSIPEALGQLSNLKILHLTGNQITFHSKGARATVQPKNTSSQWQSD